MKVLIVCLIGMIACGSGSSKISSNGSAVNGTPHVSNSGVNRSGDKGKTPARFEEKNMTEETHISQLSLTAKAEKTDESLVIEYEATNNTKQILYLLDRIPDYPDGPPVISPDLAYVFFDGPKTLNIIRANLALPTKIRVAVKEIPYLRAIAPGASAKGRISLKLPVAEFSPYYGSPNEENAEKAEASEIRLLIGWTDFRDGMLLEETTIGGEKVFVISGSWPKPYQRIAEMKIPVKVPVLVAKEDFERTMPLQ